MAEILLIAVMVMVLIVLISGIIMMTRGSDPKKQNKMMAWRVGLQAVALLLLAGLFFLNK